MSREMATKNSKTLDENFYSSMAASLSDPDLSDMSEADPHKLASSIKDLDDMDADLFGDKITKKSVPSRSGTSEGTPRTPRTVSPSVRAQNRASSPARTLSPTRGAKNAEVSGLPASSKVLSPRVVKPSSAPGKMTDLSSASEKLKPGDTVERPKTTPKTKPKYFDDFDEDDPLAGLLSDEDLSEVNVKQPIKKVDLKQNTDAKAVSLVDRPPTRSGSNDSNQSGDLTSQVVNTSKAKPAATKNDILFSDDEDMLAALDKPVVSNKTDKSIDSGKPARSVLDDLLGNKGASSLLDKPEKRERTFTLDPKYVKGSEENKTGQQDDFSFGSYMPSAAASSRPNSRRSVRFEEDDAEKEETTPRPTSRGSSQSSGPSRQRAKINLDWLIDPDLDDMKPAVDEAKDKKNSSMVTLDNNESRAELDVKSKGESADTKREEKASNWLGLEEESETENYDWLTGPSSKDVKEVPKLGQIGKSRDDSESRKAPVMRQTKVMDPQSPTLIGSGTSNVSATFVDDHKIQGDRGSAVPPKFIEKRRNSANFMPQVSPLADDTTNLPATTNIPAAFTAPNIPNTTHLHTTMTAPTSQTSTQLFTNSPQPVQQNNELQTLQMLQSQILLQNETRKLNEQQERVKLHQQQSQQRENIKLQNQQLGEMMLQLQQQMAVNITSQQSLPTVSSTSLLSQRMSILHDPNYSRLTDETKVRKLEIELGCQESLMDSTRRRYEEEIMAIEMSYKNRLKVLEETSKERENRWKEEHSQLITEHYNKLKRLEKEKSDIVSDHHTQIEDREVARLSAMDKLKETHRHHIEDLKADHSETIERIKNIKNQEIQSLLNANSTTKSIQAVIDQISSSAKNLGNLQYKMESWQQMGLDDREIHIRARDEQLKNMQAQLERQHADMGEERSRLQQLVGSLEKQLTEQTRLMEQEKWKVRQEEARVQVMQEAQDEEKRRWLETQDRHKAAVDKSKDDLMEEQRSILSQMYDERRALADERSEFEVNRKISREKDQEQAIKYIKVQAEMEAVMKASEQERVRISLKTRELEKEEANFETEWERLHATRTDLEIDREHLLKLSAEVNEKSQKVNEMLEAANKRQSEADNVMMSTKQLQTEQTQKTAQIQQRSLELQEKEKLLSQDKLNLSKEKQDLERMKDSMLCVNCRTPVRDTDPRNFTASNPTPKRSIQHIPAHQHYPTHQPILSSMNKISASIDADRSVRLWKIRAQKDKMFLQDENLFLEGLKHSPYH